MLPTEHRGASPTDIDELMQALDQTTVREAKPEGESDAD